MQQQPEIFSPKNAFIGAIVGISVGLGLLNFEACVVLPFVFAVVFGYKEPLEKIFISIEKLRQVIIGRF